MEMYLKKLAQMANYRKRLRYEELEGFPVEQLQKAGSLKKSVLAKTAECPGCSDKCEVPVQYMTDERTGERRGFHICTEKPEIGYVPIEEKRREQYTINRQFLIDHGYLEETQKKKKGADSKTKARTTFNPWKNQGDVCFVIDGDRIKFWNGDDLTDLRLKNSSRTHTLIPLLAGGPLNKQEVKKSICTKKTSPFDAIRDINRTLNNKIRILNIQNVPPNIEFISRDERTEYYCSSLPIKTFQEFDQK